MSRSKSYQLSRLEEDILYAVIKLEPRAYGINIRDQMEKYNRRRSIGSIYRTMRHLEGNGFLTSTLDWPSAVRHGRKILYFHITKEGREAVDLAYSELQGMHSGMPA